MYLVFDGGNGGHLKNIGYGSFKLFDKKGGELLEHVEKYEFKDQPMTNNEAEYATLVLALKHIVLWFGIPESLHIEGDSELVRQQVLGNWKIKKEHLKPLIKQCADILSVINNVQYDHVPREYVVEMLGH